MTTGRASTFRIGTRSSALAQWQANRVKTLLELCHPQVRCELIPIQTQGDRDKSTPLTVIGGQGVFTKDLQLAVVRGQVDCAVHSLKDLPTDLPDGLILAAVLDREDPRDVLISPNRIPLSELPDGARVGTSSRRRAAQLNDARPDVEVVELRGNVDTRMRKVIEGSPEGYDAAILAAAGVIRMGWSDQITEYLDVTMFTPAPGQAALGVDCRADDRAVQALLGAINDPETTLVTSAERAFLNGFGGGCRSPIGALASSESDGVRLLAMAASEDLREIVRRSVILPDGQEESAARRLAVKLAAIVTG